MTPSSRSKGAARRAGTAPRGHRPRGSRGAAYDLLHAVAADDAYANLIWPGILDDAGLDERDAAFATELAYGTLRWRGFHDAVIARCLDRPLAKLDPRALDLLRLGSHQILLMSTAAHAAVGETVALTKSVAGEGASRLVNAVLRRIARTPDVEAWREDVAPDDSVTDLSIGWSHPEWITSALAEALAGEGRRDELRDLLAADNTPARPVLVARPGLLSPADLQAIPGVEPGRWSPYAGTLVRGRPENLAIVQEGRAGVQDEGSQLIALALAAVEVDGGDRVWVDLAAGPGGKAALLAGLARQRGARLIAVEAHPHRADLVRRAVRAYSGDQHADDLADDLVEVRCEDARDAVFTELIDRVLIDAPCTGIGALRRRPEARWRRTPADLATLGPLQRSLLRRAVQIVRPGGVVAYATCSPHRAETDLVVEDILREQPDLELLDAVSSIPTVLGAIPDLGPGPALRLWPHRHGTDGMYLALLRRRG